MDSSRVSTGSPALDDLLGGGLERRTITQVYGEPGCGKSTLCLLAAVAVLGEGLPVVYIDSEGFSADRFRQIAGDAAESFADRLFLFEPETFDRQAIMIGECEAIVRSRHAGLIVLDSATALYRSEMLPGGEVQRRLGHQMVRLLGYAKRFDIPVLVTNQVYMDIDRGVMKGLGGTTLRHISKAIVRVEKRTGSRRAVLEKHRSLPEEAAFEFEIVKEGIKKL
ncbi:MAG: DNA repair and recombination protein RadB [Methanomicrobiaceae archaeon]|nr:DNA repair and recombination protein RadB [Methanomicrobiaceae archaeon]